MASITSPSPARSPAFQAQAAKPSSRTIWSSTWGRAPWATISSVVTGWPLFCWLMLSRMRFQSVTKRWAVTSRLPALTTGPPPGPPRKSVLPTTTKLRAIRPKMKMNTQDLVYLRRLEIMIEAGPVGAARTRRRQGRIGEQGRGRQALAPV